MWPGRQLTWNRQPELLSGPPQHWWWLPVLPGPLEPGEQALLQGIFDPVDYHGLPEFKTDLLLLNSTPALPTTRYLYVLEPFTRKILT